MRSPRIPISCVRVDAYRWGWHFRYDGGPVVGGAQGSPELGKPRKRRRRNGVAGWRRSRASNLTSSDVDHSFWVPDFLFKRDAIPGQITAFELRPDKLGTFVGRCAAILRTTITRS